VGSGPQFSGRKEFLGPHTEARAEGSDILSYRRYVLVEELWDEVMDL